MPIASLDLSALTGRADLHMHTTASDGIATPAAMLDYIAQHTDLDVIAITDHDRLDSSLWAYHQRHRYPFEIVPGMEVTARGGHVLALWIERPIAAGLSLEETAAAVHEQGGVAILAHPFEPMINGRHMGRYFWQPAVLQTMGFDAVEAHNAGAFTPGGNWLTRQRFGTTTIPFVGGSDAHMPANIGSGLTRFNGKSAADLRESLLNGQTAAEGTRWPITVYLQLYRAYRRKPQSDSSERSPASTPLTPA